MSFLALDNSIQFILKVWNKEDVVISSLLSILFFVENVHKKKIHSIRDGSFSHVYSLLLPCLQQEAQMMMKDFSVQISCPIVMLVWKHRHTTEHDVTSGDPEPELLSVAAILHAQMIDGFKARIFMNTPLH